MTTPWCIKLPRKLRILVDIPRKIIRMEAMKEKNLHAVKAAFSLARKHKADAVILHADPLEDLLYDEKWPWKFKLFLVSKKKRWELDRDNKKSLASRVEDVIVVPKITLSRTSLLKLSILLALSSGRIEQGNKLVCAVGTNEQNLIDSIHYIDTATETEIITGKASTNLADDVNPEIFQAILNLAIELSDKGREGKPVGTIFVVGDEERVLQLSKQMVINPFKGYSEDERNILTPAMRDTLREFSAMDGAFVISGDGIALTAGRFLSAAADETKLQRGWGSRHIAAAGITVLTKSIAFVISESTGDVRIFKDGKLLMEFEKTSSKRT